MSKQVTLQATLKDINGNPLSGQTIKFYKSSDNVNFNLIGTQVTDTNGIALQTDILDNAGTYYYKAVFEGTDTYDPATATATYTYTPTTSTTSSTSIFIIIAIIVVIAIVLLLIKKHT